MTTSFETLLLLTPEVVLFIAALVAYLAAAFGGLRSGWLVAVIGLGIALLLAGGQPTDGAVIASGPVTLDGFSAYIRLLTYGAGLLLALVQAGDHWRAAVQRDGGGRRHGTGEEAGSFERRVTGPAGHRWPNDERADTVNPLPRATCIVRRGRTARHRIEISDKKTVSRAGQRHLFNLEADLR